MNPKSEVLPFSSKNINEVRYMSIRAKASARPPLHLTFALNVVINYCY
jgi:hypothetical protein